MHFPGQKSPQQQEQWTLKLEPCIECQKPITDGYYARYKDGGVCSKACDIIHMRERKPYGE